MTISDDIVKKLKQPKRKPNSVRLRPKPKIEMVSDSLVIKSFNDSTKKKLTISSSATTTSYEGSRYFSLFTLAEKCRNSTILRFNFIFSSIQTKP